MVVEFPGIIGDNLFKLLALVTETSLQPNFIRSRSFIAVKNKHKTNLNWKKTLIISKKEEIVKLIGFINWLATHSA